MTACRLFLHTDISLVYQGPRECVPVDAYCAKGGPCANDGWLLFFFSGVFPASRTMRK